MSEQTYRERWRREVFRTALITDSVRVALLALADDMDGDGMVSVDRSELAGKLARSDRRVGERFTSAIAAGLLERVSRGQRNGRGRYRAALPGDPSSGRTGVLKKPGVFGTDGGPEENSLQDGLQVEETSCLRDGRGSRRSSFDPSVFRTDGGPEEPAPYRGTARAHSKTAGVGSTTATAEHDDSRRVGVVVKLFDEEIEPSLRSHTADLRSAARENPDRFDEFWNTYPRRVGKGAARKAFAKAVKNGADPEEIIWGARRYSTDPRRQAADIRYTAHPATWLNAERWTDEDAPAPRAANPRQQAVNDRYERAMQRAAAREENTR